MSIRQFEKELRKLLKQNNYHCFESYGLYIELPNDYMVEILSGKHMNLWQNWDKHPANINIIDRYENLKGLAPEEAFAKIAEWKARVEP